MMRREEKRRKFHESLLSTLYPPPVTQPEEHDEIRTTNFDVNLIPDDYGLQASGTSESDSDDGEIGSAPEKLTRAQRKRLRKKKLKDDICRRKQLVGPLLPSPSCELDGGSAWEKCTPPVRRNAQESCGAAGGQSKLKLRRMAKKLAKDRSKTKPSDCDQSLEIINGENCNRD